MYETLVVSDAWLADNLEDVRVVDVRDEWEYSGIGHVPGAVNVPFDAFRSEAHAAEREDAAGATGMLPDESDWESLLGGVGIAPDTPVVAYDDTHGVFAARFVVTALLYGHRDVHLLDGDFSAWTRAHETSTEVPTYDAVRYTVRDPERSPLIDAEGVAAAVEMDAVVVDTRAPEEYAEGHIPGAVNLDWRELVDDESRGLKPRHRLEGVLADRGITPDRRVVLYCNTARRISHTFVVLAWLGYDDLWFYEGSLTEWLADDRPLETGAGAENER